MIYTANSTVTVEGKSYRPGDSVDIQDASAAKELLAVGFIVTLPGEYAPRRNADRGCSAGTRGRRCHRPPQQRGTGSDAQGAAPDLAENMGLDTKDLTKAKLVEAIAAAEVQAEV